MGTGPISKSEKAAADEAEILKLLKAIERRECIVAMGEIFYTDRGDEHRPFSAVVVAPELKRAVESANLEPPMSSSLAMSSYSTLRFYLPLSAKQSWRIVLYIDHEARASRLVEVRTPDKKRQLKISERTQNELARILYHFKEAYHDSVPRQFDWYDPPGREQD